MKRFMLLIPVLVVAGVLLALFFRQGQTNPAVAALPETVQARYSNMTVTTSDGREFQLPDRTIVCTLSVPATAEEGIYSCPAPHDIDALLAPAQVSGNPFVAAKAAALVEIDATTFAYGLPANSWQTLQIYYGTTLNSANVMLGAELTGGETGHVENVVWPDFSSGVHPTYFYYRAKTNGSGYMGTEWLARGTQ